jgi:cobalamin-dependent methionine synthase I
VHGLSVEAAETRVRFVAEQARGELRIAGQDARDAEAAFQHVFRGSRFSFGQPVCLAAADQERLLSPLGVERVGTATSERFEPHPEPPPSALAVHHPHATDLGV